MSGEMRTRASAGGQGTRARWCSCVPRCRGPPYVRRSARGLGRVGVAGVGTNAFSAATALVVSQSTHRTRPCPARPVRRRRRSGPHPTYTPFARRARGSARRGARAALVDAHCATLPAGGRGAIDQACGERRRAQLHPCPQVEQVLARDPRHWQPSDHQQLALMPRSAFSWRASRFPHAAPSAAARPDAAEYRTASISSTTTASRSSPPTRPQDPGR
jgi:hypothetical protein